MRFCGCFPLCFPLPEIFPLNLDKDTPGGSVPPGVSLCLFQVVIVALHPAGGIALHLVGGVGVYVQRERCCCVPQKILYRFDVSTSGDSNRGTSVAEIMWAEIWSSYAGGNPLKPFVISVHGVMEACGICENQTVRVIPQLTGGESRSGLAPSLSFQIFESQSWRLDNSGFTALCVRGDVILSALFLALLELLVNGDTVVLEVNLFPR